MQSFDFLDEYTTKDLQKNRRPMISLVRGTYIYTRVTDLPQMNERCANAKQILDGFPRSRSHDLRSIYFRLAANEALRGRRIFVGGCPVSREKIDSPRS